MTANYRKNRLNTNFNISHIMSFSHNILCYCNLLILQVVKSITPIASNDTNINFEGIGTLQDITKLVSTLKESVEGTSCDEVKETRCGERNPVVENDPEKALEFAVKGLGYVIQNLECMQEGVDDQGTNVQTDGSHESRQDRYSVQLMA